jgi:hypothetical protein
MSSTNFSNAIYLCGSCIGSLGTEVSTEQSLTPEIDAISALPSWSTMSRSGFSNKQSLTPEVLAQSTLVQWSTIGFLSLAPTFSCTKSNGFAEPNCSGGDVDVTCVGDKRTPGAKIGF